MKVQSEDAWLNAHTRGGDLGVKRSLWADMACRSIVMATLAFVWSS